MRPIGPAPARTISSAQGRRIAQALTCFAWIAFAANPLHPEELKPKLGTAAISLQQSHEYLRSHPAPDYWALSGYYWPRL